VEGRFCDPQGIERAWRFSEVEFDRWHEWALAWEISRSERFVRFF
jgi:hypothetical protein